MTAALGKIEVESAELQPKEIMEDWVEYLKSQCMENELMAYSVRKKEIAERVHCRFVEMVIWEPDSH